MNLNGVLIILFCQIDMIALAYAQPSPVRINVDQVYHNNDQTQISGFVYSGNTVIFSITENPLPGTKWVAKNNCSINMIAISNNDIGIPNSNYVSHEWGYVA